MFWILPIARHFAFQSKLWAILEGLRTAANGRKRFLPRQTGRDDRFEAPTGGAVYATAVGLPWAAIEAAVAPKLARQALSAERLCGKDLLGAYDAELEAVSARPPARACPSA